MGIRNSTVCWMLPDVGYYHDARMRAFANLSKHNCVILEAFKTSDFAAFRRDTKGNEAYRVVRLGQSRSSWNSRGTLQAEICNTLEKIAPSIVCIPGWSGIISLTGLRWCSDKHVPAVIFSESAEHDAKRLQLFEWVKEGLLSMCSAALVGGRVHRDYLVKLGYDPDKIFFGYDVVDNNYFACSGSARGMPRLGGDHRRGNHFLASARFIPKKNLPGLLKAYSKYRSKVQEAYTASPWDLVLLGDGPQRIELKALSTQLGLSNCVHMLGFKGYSELPLLFGSAGAFVHASSTEQWGLVVNEAMASGLPVLVSNRCGCVADLVREGVNGYSFNPHDSSELADLMVRISAPGFPREEFGLAGQKIIAEWGPERFADGLNQAVDCALRGGPARGKGLAGTLLKLMLLI